MKGYIIKKCALSATLFLLFICFEMITLKFVGLPVLPKYWIVDVGAFLILSLIVFLMPFLMSVVFANLLLLVQLILCLTNIILFKSMGGLFDWSMIGLLGEAQGVVGMAEVPVFQTVLLCILFIYYLLFSIILCCYQKQKYYKSFIHKFVYVMAVAVACSVVAIEAIIPSFVLRKYDKSNYYISDSFIYSTFNSSITGIETFGMFGYYYNTLLRNIFPSLIPELKIEPEWKSRTYVSDLHKMCEGDNVVFIMAESFESYAISKTTTPVLYALKNGIDLSGSGISSFYDVGQNPETGEYILKRKDFDDNMLFNGVDIFDGLVEDEVGLELNDYRAVEYTRFSEMNVLTGTACDYVEENSIPNVLKQQNIITNYVHGNYGSYFERVNRMNEEVLGFQNVLFYDGLQGKVNSTENLSFFLKDRDVVRYCLANDDAFELFNNNQFFTFYLTISTHGYYDLTQTTEPLMKEYLDKFDAYLKTGKIDDVMNAYNSYENEDVKKLLHNYLASAIDTEEAIALMVHELFVSGKLDNTVIALVADHQSYSNNLEEYKRYYLKECEKRVVNAVDMYLLPAFIYSGKIKNIDLNEMGYDRNINYLTSGFDIAPTIFSLLGVEFNQKNYLGYAVINKDIETGGLVNDGICYSSTFADFYTDKYIHLNGRDSDFDGLNIEEKEEIRKSHLVMNDIYNKKYYIEKYT